MCHGLFGRPSPKSARWPNDQAAAAAPWPIVPSAPSPWRDQEIGGSQRSLGGGWRGALSARAALQSTTSACVQPVLASGQLTLRTRFAEDASSVISQCYGCKGRESGEAAQVYGAAGGAADVAPLQRVECRWKSIHRDVHTFVPLYRRSLVALLRGVRISCGRARPSVLVRKNCTCLRRGGS